MDASPIIQSVDQEHVSSGCGKGRTLKQKRRKYMIQAESQLFFTFVRINK